jgi:lipoprotein NlpD
MFQRPESRAVRLAAVVALMVLAGCTTATRKAPVEDRSKAARPPSVAAQPATTAPAPVPVPAADNAGRAAFYTVKPGDTLLRIALDHGQNWRDLARWNNLDNPNLVEVGQVLRVVPPAAPVPAAAPAGEPAAAIARAVPGAGRVETRPLDSRAASVPAGTVVAAAPPTAPPAPPPPPAPAAATAPAPAAATASPSVPATAAEGSGAARGGTDELVWIWPAAGTVVAGFDEARNKGLTIAGKAGDPVLAAGDGRVVYAGSSLRGYGNLVIVKHNEVFLTAYAHNQALLVKDDQIVRRGQKIAEMGSTDAERVQLHFEIRRQGRPVDPAKLLPPR